MIVAHVGHWAVQLLYVLPVLLVAAAIVWSKLQERREEAEEADEAAENPGPDGRD